MMQLMLLGKEGTMSESIVIMLLIIGIVLALLLAALIIGFITFVLSSMMSDFDIIKKE